MQKDNMPKTDAATRLIPCSKNTAAALKKGTIIHIGRLVFLLLATLWLSGYPRTIWQIGLFVLFGLCALTELCQFFFDQRSLHTDIVLSPDSVSLKSFGSITKSLRWDELKYIGKAKVKIISITQKTHPYIVLSKYKPEHIGDASEAVRVHPKETILVEDTEENWEMIKSYCSNAELLT